jgi:hypothetical protein
MAIKAEKIERIRCGDQTGTRLDSAQQLRMSDFEQALTAVLKLNKESRIKLYDLVIELQKQAEQAAAVAAEAKAQEAAAAAAAQEVKMLSDSPLPGHANKHRIHWQRLKMDTRIRDYRPKSGHWEGRLVGPDRVLFVHEDGREEIFNSLNLFSRGHLKFLDTKGIISRKKPDTNAWDHIQYLTDDGKWEFLDAAIREKL